MDDSDILITGAGGQVGRALSGIYPNAIKTDSKSLDITDPEALRKFDWQDIKIIINAAAYTNVDGAETPEGNKLAQAVNNEAVGNLAEVAADKGLLLVHISTSYVFDGRKKIYKEDDVISPLGNYAKSKAAGDEQAKKARKHYIIRTDSVIGDGKNFVRTMLDLGKKGITPTVVADQFMRPTFATELAKAIKFLIDNKATYGIYNMTNEGAPVSWAGCTRAIFNEAGFGLDVIDTTYQAYSAGRPGIAPRPLNSVVDLTKIESLGFRPCDWHDDLKEYVKKELNK